MFTKVPNVQTFGAPSRRVNKKFLKQNIPYRTAVQAGAGPPLGSSLRADGFGVVGVTSGPFRCKSGDFFWESTTCPSITLNFDWEYLTVNVGTNILSFGPPQLGPLRSLCPGAWPMYPRYYLGMHAILKLTSSSHARTSHLIISVRSYVPGLKQSYYVGTIMQLVGIP